MNFSSLNWKHDWKLNILKYKFVRVDPWKMLGVVMPTPASVDNLQLGFPVLHFSVSPFSTFSSSTNLGQYQFSRSVMSDTLRPHGLKHTRPPCPSPTPRGYSNSCPSCQWWHPTISSSVVPFSSGLWSFPASGFFPMSHFFNVVF